MALLKECEISKCFEADIGVLLQERIEQHDLVCARRPELVGDYCR